jgi:hypothetical protein
MTLKLTKLLAFALIASFALVSVQAKTQVMGRLKTRDNKPVSVNGQKATSGTTVLSGAEIVSPAKVGATLDLGTLGRIDMAPNTSMTVNFSATQVSVQLKAGYVVLTTGKGVAGVVNTTDGQTFNANGSSVVAKMKNVTGPEAGVGVGAAKAGLGTGAVVGAAGAGAAVVGGVAAANNGRGSNLSGTTPRQQ